MTTIVNSIADVVLPNLAEAFEELRRSRQEEVTIGGCIDPTPDNSVVRQFVALVYHQALDSLACAWGRPAWEGPVGSRASYRGPKPWASLEGGYYRAVRAAWWKRDDSWSVVFVTIHDGSSLVMLSIAVEVSHKDA